MNYSLDILDFEELIVLAKLDLEANNLSDALVKLKLAHSSNGNSESLVMLARLYARLGLFDKSVPLFQEYLKENPDALHEKFQYGMSLFDNNQDEEALEVFEDIIDSEEAIHPPAMFYSTLILSKQNKNEAAVSRLIKILSTVDDKNLFYRRAHEELSQLNPQKASQFSIIDSQNQAQMNNNLIN